MNCIPCLHRKVLPRNQSYQIVPDNRARFADDHDSVSVCHMITDENTPTKRPGKTANVPTHPIGLPLSEISHSLPSANKLLQYEIEALEGSAREIMQQQLEVGATVAVTIQHPSESSWRNLSFGVLPRILSIVPFQRR